jgi:hypothetical protein
MAVRVYTRKQDQVLKDIYPRFGRAVTDCSEADAGVLCLLVFDKCSKDLADDHSVSAVTNCLNDSEAA